jgi:hypothetical protein
VTFVCILCTLHTHFSRSICNSVSTVVGGKPFAARIKQGVCLAHRQLGDASKKGADTLKACSDALAVTPDEERLHAVMRARLLLARAWAFFRAKKWTLAGNDADAAAEACSLAGDCDDALRATVSQMKVDIVDARTVAEAKSDYYELLGITSAATTAEIKKGFRKMALLYHPDRNKAEDAAEMFIRR